MDINAQLTVIATYDDIIRVYVTDKASGKTFLEMDLTREQFINATMNRLGNTEVNHASVSHLNLVGKQQVIKEFEFEIPTYMDKEYAIENVRNVCPERWTPDMGFNKQDTFFDKDGKHYARTTIRKWVQY